jgi:hypothetical protein
MEQIERQCLQCGHVLRGRVDKKFCDDACRNTYNNRKRGDIPDVLRRVNTVLRRNRDILASMLPRDANLARCSRYQLMQQGFNFSYHTQHYVSRKGDVYIFCYEYGYLYLKDEWVLIVKQEVTDGELPSA